jgi:hypothetical protein
MPARLPPTALALGLAGLIPFLLCAIAALSMPDARAVGWITALLAYGAVTLAMLGGVHWGLVLAAPEAGPRDPLRLALGVLPSLIGWAALLVPLVLPIEVGLAVLIAGFAATVLTEAHLRRGGLVPSGYMWLRWGYSLVVVAVLVTLLTMRLLHLLWPGMSR